MNLINELKLKDFNFSSQKILTTFYFLILSISIVHRRSDFGTGHSIKSWPGVLQIFNFIDPQVINFDWLFLASLASLTLGVFFSQYRLIRIVIFICTLLMLSSHYVPGEVTQGEHIFTYLSCLFIFLSHKPSKTNAVILLMAQYFCLSTYASSGIHKLIELSGYIFEPSFRFSDILRFHIVWAVKEGYWETPLSRFLLDHAWICSLAWAGVLFIEVGAAVAIFSYRAWKHWWKFLILIHIGAGVVIDVHFFPQPMMLVWLFGIAPYLTGAQAETKTI